MTHPTTNLVSPPGFGEQTSPQSAALSCSSIANATRAVAPVTPLLTAAVTAINALSSSSESPMPRALSIRFRVQTWQPRVIVTARPTKCFSRSLSKPVSCVCLM